MRDSERRAEAQRPVDEAGGGNSEGFELAEQDLIEHASHGDMHAATRAAEAARESSEDHHLVTDEAEGDAEHSSERPEDDR